MEMSLFIQIISIWFHCILSWGKMSKKITNLGLGPIYCTDIIFENNNLFGLDFSIICGWKVFCFGLEYSYFFSTGASRKLCFGFVLNPGLIN